MTRFSSLTLGALWVLLGVGVQCARVPSDDSSLQSSSSSVRSERRAFDGAPPVIPHENFKMSCTNCHGSQGVEVPGVGFAPPLPHGETQGLSDAARCSQCHLFRATEAVFRKSEFVGIPQSYTPAHRQYVGAPPVLPHRIFMRENCVSCHSGPSARAEIATDHPERSSCLQCHLSRGGDKTEVPFD